MVGDSDIAALVVAVVDTIVGDSVGRSSGLAVVDSIVGGSVETSLGSAAAGIIDGDSVESNCVTLSGTIDGDSVLDTMVGDSVESALFPGFSSMQKCPSKELIMNKRDNRDDFGKNMVCCDDEY
jgi:hypothetical protein